MQLQIEHAYSLLTQPICVTCSQHFQPNLARVIVCNREGEAYGDICAQCLALGSSFVRGRLQEVLEDVLDQSEPRSITPHSSAPYSPTSPQPA